MNEPNIDDAIGRVARELTRDRVDPAFRARVVARIERGTPVPTQAWRRLGWILPAAAVLAVAAVVLSTMRQGSPARNDAVRAPAREAQSTQAQDRVVATPSPAVSTTHAANTVRPPAAAPRTARTSPVEMLAPPPLAAESIAVEPMGVPEASAIESIELSALTVPPIDVGPLAPDDRPETRRPQ